MAKVAKDELLFFFLLIFATFAIMWQKWQMDEYIIMIFATFAIMWQKWQKMNYYYDDFCHICHHVAKVAEDELLLL